MFWLCLYLWTACIPCTQGPEEVSDTPILELQLRASVWVPELSQGPREEPPVLWTAELHLQHRSHILVFLSGCIHNQPIVFYYDVGIFYLDKSSRHWNKSLVSNSRDSCFPWPRRKRNSLCQSCLICKLNMMVYNKVLQGLNGSICTEPLTVYKDG